MATAVATGAAEMGITFTSELKPNPGVKVAGTLPAAIQSPTIYAVALVPTSGSADAAREFVKVLSGAEGRAAIERAGLNLSTPVADQSRGRGSRQPARPFPRATRAPRLRQRRDTAA